MIELENSMDEVDYKILIKQLNSYMVNKTSNDMAISDISNTYYNFDRIDYLKLIKLDKSSMLSELKKISKKI